MRNNNYILDIGVDRFGFTPGPGNSWHGYTPDQSKRLDQGREKRRGSRGSSKQYDAKRCAPKLSRHIVPYTAM